MFLAKIARGLGTCHNMVMGRHIEVIYANVGSLANPQAKILGVRYNYADGSTLKYKVGIADIHHVHKHARDFSRFFPDCRIFYKSFFASTFS